METLTIHPRNKKQLNVLKSLLEELKIPFEKSDTGKSPYGPEFVKKIKESEKQISEGKFKAYTLEEFEKLCK